MKITLKRPCDDCPFRRVSAPGWLGPWDPNELLHHLGRGEFPCHKTITDQELTTDDTLQGCAGAAIFLNNKVERSRHPRVAEHQDAVAGVDQAIKDSVFQWAHEFLEHHKK